MDTNNNFANSYASNLHKLKSSLQAQADRLNWQPMELVYLFRDFFSLHPSKIVDYTIGLSTVTIVILYVFNAILASVAWMLTLNKLTKDILELFGTQSPNGRLFLFLLLLNFVIYVAFVGMWYLIDTMIRGKSSLIVLMDLAARTLIPTISGSLICLIIAFLSPSIAMIILVSTMIMTVMLVFSHYNNSIEQVRIDLYWFFVFFAIAMLSFIYLIIRTSIIPLLFM